MKKSFKKILDKVNGRKTTIAALLAFVITILFSMNIIDEKIAIALNTLLVALGLGSNFANYKIDKVKNVESIIEDDIN